MSDEPPRFDPAGLAELPDKLALGRLPAGRHSLPRSFVVRHQRLRILAAMLRALSLYGYAGITIDHLTGEAGVSRTAFYGQFAGKEDCFLATYDLAGEWLCERVTAVVDVDGGWPERVRDGVSEVLRLLAANPALARLIAVEALAAGPIARQRQQAYLASFAEALRAGRPSGTALPVELEEMLLGGVIATIGRYVDAGRPEQLSEATEEMVLYLLIPYLGPEERQRIARAA
jgi:AcrR family transcriptional regulator